MTQAPAIGDGLTRVATYRRSISASLERVWENVLDWEHLPWLHHRSFVDASVIDSGDWGWRARLGIPDRATGRREIELELLIEGPGDRYVSRTTQGQGAGTEIWTTLQVEAPGRTGIDVEFWLPGVAPGREKALGAVFTALYAQLWDEDEQMMRHRQAQLEKLQTASGQATERANVDLGLLSSLQDRLPLDLEIGGRPFRLIEHEGKLVAHSTVCPHRLGPLGDSPPEGRELRCPWHGYRFDLFSGASCEGRRLRLEPAPSVQVDPCTSLVVLSWD
jgi:nitrite reductase/ring-hydroxylating ferredoxin subunit